MRMNTMTSFPSVVTLQQSAASVVPAYLSPSTSELGISAEQTKRTCFSSGFRFRSVVFQNQQQQQQQPPQRQSRIGWGQRSGQSGTSCKWISARSLWAQGRPRGAAIRTPTSAQACSDRQVPRTTSPTRSTTAVGSHLDISKKVIFLSSGRSRRTSGYCHLVASSWQRNQERCGLDRNCREMDGRGNGSPRAEARAVDTVAEVAPCIVSATIVGAGRVGAALEKMGKGDDVVVRRGDTISSDGQGPILVCTRNVDLDAVVEATPPSRREDLVFMQNGMIEPWLVSKGLEKNTQVLVYFAVAKLGDKPVDGKTDVNPEGLTAATGKWATAVASRLHSAGLSCKVLDAESFKKPMLEKLTWISAFMLVGARHPGATVGDVESTYRGEVSLLVNELAAAAAAAKGVEFDDGLVDRLCAYARSVAHFPTAVKEFEWRNGWFYSISKMALGEGKPDPCPLHTAWLQEVGAI